MVKNNEIISENAKGAEIMNDHFVNITTELNMCMPSDNVVSNDSVDKIILSYRSYPSIIKIRERIEHHAKFEKFSFIYVTVCF